MNYYEQKSGILLKRITQILIVLFFFLGVIGYFVLNSVMVTVYQGISILITGFILLVNKKQYTDTAKYLLAFFVPSALIFISIHTKVISVSNNVILYLAPRLLLAMSILIPALLFGYRDLKKSLIALFPGIALFLLFDPIHQAFGIELKNLTFDYQYYSVFVIITSFFLLFIILSIFLFQNVNSVYEQTLESLNLILSDSKEELIKTNQNLVLAKEKAEESDRLKSAFLSNLSHEIRTPLNGIMGAADLLIHYKDNAAKASVYSNIIMSNSQQLLDIIENIIEISEIEANLTYISKSKFSINDLLAEIFNDFQSSHADKLNILDFRVNKIIHEKQRHIYADKDKIRVIFNCLLNNAFKFTNKGFIDFGYTIKNDQQLEFYVEDTGIGIPTEKQSIMFDNFRQSDDSMTRQYGGTGLGLAITKKLIHVLGGCLTFKTRPDQGTIFYFTL